MSMLGTIFSKKQTCPNCKQRSNPVAGKGNWEVSGRMGSASVIKCTNCGAGLIMGLMSDRYIPPADMKRIETERDKIIGQHFKNQE
jgi:ribosomal protein S27AE